MKPHALRRSTASSEQGWAYRLDAQASQRGWYSILGASWEHVAIWAMLVGLRCTVQHPGHGQGPGMAANPAIGGGLMGAWDLAHLVQQCPDCWALMVEVSCGGTAAGHKVLPSGVQLWTAVRVALVQP